MLYLLLNSFIKYLEKTFNKPAPKQNIEPQDDIYPETSITGLNKNAVIVIVGGGLSGSAFARKILTLCRKTGQHPKVYLVNSSGCNYCGGLITDLARETMINLFDLHTPHDVILNNVSECIFINKEGNTQVNLNIPMLTTLRTSRFGITGFDDSLKSRILEGIEDMEPCFNIIEPTLVRQIIPLTEPGKQYPDNEPKWKVVLSLKKNDGSYEELDAHVLVLATGFRSLGKPMLQNFQALTGYIPPPLMEGSVTEVDTSTAKHNLIANRILVIDGLVEDAVIAFIPKGKNWLTLTMLGKKLTAEELDVVFDHPQVKKYLDLPQPSKHLRCRTICPAKLFIGFAQNFYGDGWVMLGDLTGYGRVLKDGVYASFLHAHLAAEAICHHGASKEAFARFYHQPLQEFKWDNQIGMLLFRINTQLNRRSWFNKLFITAAETELEKDSQGAAMQAGIRGLMTGRIPYRLIGVFFVMGLMYFIVRHPLRTLRTFLGQLRGN
ncbi:MAG: hypothetical protein WA118_09505 [Carboxydocellales bacterium]